MQSTGRSDTREPCSANAAGSGRVPACGRAPVLSKG